MKILATYNIKGGVGKTASAVNLSWLAARQGCRTLLWDLDPQGAATFYFRVKAKVKGGAKTIVDKKKSLAKLVKGTDFPLLDLLPADFTYRHLDLLLDGEKKPTRRLRKQLREMASDYDLVMLDCPPSISLVSEAVFRAADVLLVPIIPSTLSLRTLDQLLAFRNDSGLEDLVILPFFSMADRRKRLHREIMATLGEKYPELLASFVPYLSDVEKMGINRSPIGEFAPNSPACRAFTALWREILATGLI